MSQFKKGEGGRPKGSSNKITYELREWITHFIHGNTAQIQQDWMALEPKDRILMFEKLLKYTLPSLQAVTASVEIEKLTDEQLDEITNRILRAA